MRVFFESPLFIELLHAEIARCRRFYREMTLIGVHLAPVDPETPVTPEIIEAFEDHLLRSVRRYDHVGRSGPGTYVILLPELGRMMGTFARQRLALILIESLAPEWTILLSQINPLVVPQSSHLHAAFGTQAQDIADPMALIDTVVATARAGQFDARHELPEPSSFY